MKIFVNGREFEVAPGSSVAALLALKGLDPRRVFVAVNGDVVGVEDQDSRGLVEADRIELVSFVGGG